MSILGTIKKLIALKDLMLLVKFKFGVEDKTNMKVCISCKKDFERNNWICPACGYEPQSNNGFLFFSNDSSQANEGFASGYFENLASLEASNFWFCSRNKLIVWTLGKYFPHATDFFEVGCGTGFVLSGIEKAFPDLDLYGSEIFKEGLEFAKKRTKAKFFQMDARLIPFKEEFDVMGAFDVLEHIKEDEEVLEQMYKAIKPGGGLILTVPQHKFLWSKVDEVSFHKRRYGINELKTKIENAGFKVLTSTSFVAFLLPFITLSRMRLKLLNGKFDLYSEFKLNTILNTVFEVILNLETILIKIGMRFPFGSSLLIVATK